MKNKATSAPPPTRSASGRKVASAKSGELRISGKSAVPDDVRRNTYTKDRPAGLHVKRLHRSA